MKSKLWLFLGVLLLAPLGAGQAEVKSKFELEIYGYVKTDVVYQHGLGVLDTQIIWAAPGNMKWYPDPKQNIGRVRNQDFNTFLINSFQTRFGFLVTGPEAHGIWSRGRIEGDFYSKFPQYGSDYGADYKFPANADPETNKGTLMLRRATVEFGQDWWEILAGNEWMVASPIFPHLNNYPYGAEIGNLGYRVPQVRLTLNALKKKIQLQVAVDNKVGDPGYKDMDTGRADIQPTVEFGLLYNGTLSGKPLKFGFTGHQGSDGRVCSDGKWRGQTVPSYSYNLDWIIPLWKFTLSGEAFTGANLDGWFTGAQGDGWIYDPHGGGFQALKDQGGWIELMLTPVKDLDVLAGYGIDDKNDDQLDHGRAIVESVPALAGAGSNKAITKNQMYWGAVNYRLNSAVMLSAEYMQVLTTYGLANHHQERAAGLPLANQFKYEQGKADRYTLAFWFMF